MAPQPSPMPQAAQTSSQSFTPTPRRTPPCEARDDRTPVKQAARPGPMISSGCASTVPQSQHQARRSISNVIMPMGQMGCQKNEVLASMINGNMAMAPTYSEKKNPLTLPINGDMAMVPTYSEKISANSPNGVSPNRLGGASPIMIMSEYHKEFAEAKLPKKFFKLMSKTVGVENEQGVRSRKNYRNRRLSGWKTDEGTIVENIWDDDEALSP